MKLAVEAVDLDALRLDGGTQVRDGLNLDWVGELAALYEDGDHQIEPIIVMRDRAGVLWLVDGFHRVAAMRRAGLSGATARMLHGEVEAARFEAAARGKGGLLRNPGDKKRAVLLALSTEQGRKMGQRELARHCGVAHRYVQVVISGEVVATSSHLPDRSMSKRVEKAALRDVALTEALRRDSDRSDDAVAEEVGCDVRYAREQRRRLGIPNEKDRASQRREVARAAFESDPQMTVGEAVRLSGASRQVVVALREELGRPRADFGAGARRVSLRRSDQPSAPPRKANDPRTGADAKVIHLRPRAAIGPELEEDRELEEHGHWFDCLSVERKRAFLVRIGERAERANGAS